MPEALGQGALVLLVYVLEMFRQEIFHRPLWG